MRIRRIATAASTIVVAIVVALAVPVSQLRTMSIVTTCCCPDPSNCHCPDHKPDHGTQPSMRACHRSSQELVTPQLPSFTSPEIAIAPAPVHVVVAEALPLDSPRPAPARPRPDAPS